MKNTYGLTPEYFEQHFSQNAWADPANVPGADASTWQLLNRAWAVDAASVYLNGKRLKEVDRVTFRVLNEMYARDDTRIFCVEGLTAVAPDPATFEVLDDGGGRFSGDFRSYARDAAHVYYAETCRPMKIVKDADPATFVVLPHWYGHDAKSLYFEGKPVRNSTPENVEFLDERYVRAGTGVFFDGKRVAHAKAKEFRVLDAENRVWRDDERVFLDGFAVDGADPSSFVMLAGGVGRDARQVFVCGKAIPGIDMPTFRHLGFDYFCDRKDYYWAGEPLEFVHRKSFVATGYGEGRDKHRQIYKAGKYSNSLEERYAKLKRDSAIWSLLKLLSLMLFAVVTAIVTAPYMLWKKFRKRRAAAGEAGDRGNEHDVAVLARTLAMGNEKALAPVLLATRDMVAFREKYLGREVFAGEPDYEEMSGRVGDPDDEDALDPFLVFETVFSHYRLLGIIDWRSGTDETQPQIDAMLARFGIDDFDWSFIEILVEHGKGPELANHNFLTLLRDELAKRGLKLVHVNLMGDSYGFAVVRLADFAAIDGLGGDHFLVSDEFGADKDYKHGKAILEQYLR